MTDLTKKKPSILQRLEEFNDDQWDLENFSATKDVENALSDLEFLTHWQASTYSARSAALDKLNYSSEEKERMLADFAARQADDWTAQWMVLNDAVDRACK